jgi:hypothetical protein
MTFICTSGVGRDEGEDGVNRFHPLSGHVVDAGPAAGRPAIEPFPVAHSLTSVDGRVAALVLMALARSSPASTRTD